MGIEYSVSDGVATITINRPERKNAILLAMRTEIQHAFERAQDDDDVRAIIFTGAGNDFSAGGDVITIEAATCGGSACSASTGPPGPRST